jgi:hypothetical protein
VSKCGQVWRNDPTRRCEALRVADLDACLAHLGTATRQHFLTSALSSPSAMTGVLQDLEVQDDLLVDLAPILQRVRPIDFQGSEFFAGYFFRVQFAGKVDFSRCKFHEKAFFDESVFPGIAYFLDAEFEKEASFGGAEFGDQARFDKATFKEGAIFGAKFCNEVWFDRATFRSHVTLSLRDGLRVRFDDAQLAMVVLGAYDGDRRDCEWVDGEGSSRVPDSRPIVIFNGATFSAGASVRTRTDVDVSLARIVLRNPLSVACWQGEMRLLSLRAAVLEAPLLIGDGVDLGACRMSQATGLDNLRILGSRPGWRTFRRRPVVADELESVRGFAGHLPAAPADVGGELIRPVETSPTTVESVYRQLRVALDASKAYAAAADFFYNEMEMRRLAARRLSFDRALLFSYKLGAGYGVRASRALLAYLVIVLLAGVALRYQTTWFVADPLIVAGSSGLRFTQYWDCVAVAARNSVTFFGGISSGLTAAGTGLMFALRLIGPAAVALAILALRTRVQR